MSGHLDDLIKGSVLLCTYRTSTHFQIQSAELREVTEAELNAEDERSKLRPTTGSFCHSASSLSSLSSVSRRSAKKPFDFSLD